MSDQHSSFICPECRYSLEGLLANEDETIGCPECGQNVMPTSVALLRKHQISEAMSITKFIVIIIAIMISPIILYLLFVIIVIFSSGLW